MNKQKIKLDDKSALVVDVVVGERINPDGRKMKQIRRIRVDRDVNLGSVNNPKENIVAAEWIDTTPMEERIKGMFDGLNKR